MVARMILEFDNETSPGFQQLVRDFEAAERGADDLAESAYRDSVALEAMQKQQLATTNAIAANTAAVEANKDSLIENFNTVAAFTGHVRNMGAAVVGTSVLLADHTVKMGLFESRAEAGALAAKSFALRMLKVGSPVFGATAAIQAFNSMAKQTGHRLVALSKDTPRHIQNMADAVTNGFMTIEDLEKRAGASIDELGLRYETNADRISAAQGKLGKTAMKDIGVAFQWLGDIADNVGRKIDDEMTRLAGNVERNVEVLMRLDDMRTGRDTAARKENERLAEYNQRIAEGREALNAFNATLNDQMKLRRELFDISMLQTREQVQEAIKAENKIQSELLNTNQIKAKAGQASNARMQALRRREVQMHEAAERKKLEVSKRAAAERMKIFEKNQAAERAAFAANFKQRQDFIKREMELEEMKAAGIAGLRLQENLNFLELLKQKLKLQGGHEQEVLAIEKTAAQQQLKFALDQAKTEEDRIQARFDYERRLRELNLQHALDTQQKKHEAIKTAEQKAVAEQKKAVDEVRAYRDKEGRNAFRHISGKQDPNDIREQIAKQRIAKAKEERGGDNLTPQRQQHLEKQTRMQLFRDSKAGRVNRQEVQRAIRALVEQKVRAAQASGEISVDVMNEVLRMGAELKQNTEGMERMKAQFNSARQRNVHTRARGQLP